MSSKKPVIHGRDHLPGGSDPIPITPFTESILNPDYGMYDTSNTTVPQNTADQPAEWLHTGGTAMLDLTDPFTPAIITRGVYSVTGTVSFDSGWTPGVSFPFGEFLILGLPSTDFWFQSQQHNSGFGDFPTPASFSMTFQADVGQQMQLTFSNFDNTGPADHDFSGGQIRVQRLFSY